MFDRIPLDKTADTLSDAVSDEKLIAESVEGNKHSLNRLIKRHQDYIYNIALKLFLNPDDALDATQEVLIKVITGLKTFEGKSAFRTWLYRIVFNHFLNSPVRRMETLSVQHAEAFAALPAESDADDASEEAVEEVRILCSTAMLMCLTREQRLIYIIGEVFGADHRLGAELFDVSPANFRVKLHRAKSDLLSYVSGKCGLIDAKNSCRCHKKAKAMVAQGIVDQNRMQFNTGYRQKIHELVSAKREDVSDEIQLKLSELFQDSPFQIRDELDALFEALLNRYASE